MTSVGLVWSNLGRRKLRTALSTLSILVAFLLFGYLSAIKAALDGGNFGAGGQDRLIVRNRVSITQPLPGTYGRRIAMIPGVTTVTHATWFGGIYQDPKNFFGQLAVVPEDYLRVYTEDLLSGDEKKAWLATKNGAVAGRTVAKKYGWKVGDRIPLKATIWVKSDGSLNWDFTLVGIYDGAKVGTDTNLFLFRDDYFDDARLWDKGKVLWYVVEVNSANATDVARRIDSEFADSSVETKTESEGAFNQGFAKQVGDIGAIMLGILGPVFLTILLIAANTMRQSVRERTAELGVLKAMGFRDGRIIALVLAESCFLASLGGGLGLGTAWLLISAGDPTRGGLPLFHFPTLDLLKGVALVLALGVVTGILPAMQAMRIQVAEALRRT
jgi:putative ABC transport system permease protein